MGPHVRRVIEVDDDRRRVGVLHGQELAEDRQRRAFGEVPFGLGQRRADHVRRPMPVAVVEVHGALHHAGAGQRHDRRHLLVGPGVGVDVFDPDLAGGQRSGDRRQVAGGGVEINGRRARLVRHQDGKRLREPAPREALGEIERVAGRRRRHQAGGVEELLGVVGVAVRGHHPRGRHVGVVPQDVRPVARAVHVHGVDLGVVDAAGDIGDVLAGRGRANPTLEVVGRSVGVREEALVRDPLRVGHRHRGQAIAPGQRRQSTIRRPVLIDQGLERRPAGRGGARAQGQQQHQRRDERRRAPRDSSHGRGVTGRLMRSVRTSPRSDRDVGAPPLRCRGTV